MAVLPENIIVRKAQPQDLQAVYDLIHELAVYEKEPQEPTNPFSVFVEQASGSNPWFKVLVTEYEGDIIGMALYYNAYSTWKGAMFYLDDIVVKEAFRRYGVGSKLFDRLIEEAKIEQVNLIKWQVLDWNEPAISFYQKYGAEIGGGEWYNCRLFKEDFK